jgi:primosomal protein N' (replication factor Y) (superfamily II helicase)
LETLHTYRQFVNVILPLALPKLYTYAVPQSMETHIVIGARVEVQFGRHKLYAALVHSVSSVPPSDYVPKEILSVIDEQPVMTAAQLKFWEWMAGYYMCTLGEVMQAALPAYFKLDSETYFVRNPESEVDLLELSDDEYLIAEALNHQPEITFKDITLILSKVSVTKPVKSLLQKKVMYVKETLHERYTPKVESFVRLANRFADGGEKLQAAFSAVEKYPKQELLLLAFIELSKNNKPVKKSELLKRADASASSLESLVKKDILQVAHQVVDRISGNEFSEQENYTLSAAQQTALDEIKAHFESKDVVLLHGITSSGKTLMYLDLIKAQIESGKQVLYLIPEISLTVQLIQRIEKMLGSVAVYHSRFSNAERVEIWNKILSGQTKVVIGARSSVFLPFQDLGLVIVDEEHDTSYKQYDPAPRYQCRDAAIYLARQFQAKVVLGTATPSVESYSNAKTGKYGLVEIHNRFGDIQLPEIEFVSMTDAKKKKEIVSGISFVLRDEIQLALDNKEQVILFQNRRGYAPYLACGNCNWIPMCIHCDVSLTYHKFTNDLRCHYCGYTQQVINTCTACGSHEMEQRGLGTERIEEDLKLLFPKANIGRMDYDTTRTKKGHEKIIDIFESGGYDILVGTQMVTKGLDFGNVRLVGVLNADALLYYPDFRALERAYQLLLQVSGRAGRREKRGKVMIQIGNTDHVITDLIKENNYEAFYKTQMAERQQFHYPPYSRLIQLTIKHKDIKVTIEAASRVADYLNAKHSGRIVGPNAPVIQKINNYYLRDVLIKIPRASKELQKIKSDIRQAINALYQFQSFKQVRVVIDVDCY